MSQLVIPDASTLDVEWQKSSASTGDGNCVEVATHGDGIAVRHSKVPNGPALIFTRDEIAAWLDGAKSGEFDHLTR
ncbi:DUF397 domain-containing protein [Streptomyces sp. NPDC059743]|uniref:DUF397 domain-containing protein n=1 Tax=Streptomyces sp. NPDC059743 TaxID=3346928 RepID=UPI003655BEA3